MLQRCDIIVVQSLLFEDSVPALHRGVVDRRPLSAHRNGYAFGGTDGFVLNGCILEPLITVNDESVYILFFFQGFVQRVYDYLYVISFRYLIRHDVTVVQIDDRR